MANRSDDEIDVTQGNGFGADFHDVANACTDALYAATDGTNATMVAAGAALWLNILYNASDGDENLIEHLMTEWCEHLKEIARDGRLHKMFDEPSADRPTLQ